MNASYTNIKTFIDSQVKILSEILVVDENIRDILNHQGDESSITEEKLQQVLNKLNTQIRKHHRRQFTKQAIHQISSQLITLQTQKLIDSEFQLNRATEILLPISTPDFDLENLDDILDHIPELPDVKYLKFDTNNEDDHNQLEKYRISRDKLLEARRKFIETKEKKEIYEELHSMVSQYLSNPKENIQKNLLTSSSDIFNEIVRLRILIARVMAKLNTQKGENYINEINEDDNENRQTNTEDEISLEKLNGWK